MRFDVLVLGAGGILGEAWISSLLAGLEESSDFDARACDHYVGTSAGSIVAAMLCAGIDPRTRLGELPEPPADDEPAERPAYSPGLRALRLGATVASAVTGPLATAALHTTTPGGRVLRRAALSRIPRGRRSLEHLRREVERVAVEWDGRLQVAVVELQSGRRVMLDGSREPRVSVAQAVEASCAIPGVFRPLEVDGRSYVDGGAWSTTNFDTAPVWRGARVLCLNATGGMRPGRRTPFGAIGPISRYVGAVEAAALRRRGAQVTVVSPDAEAAAAMGSDLMDPGPRSRVLSAGLAQGRRLGAG